MCDIRCRTADSPVEKCQCSCGGENHGSQMLLWDFDFDELVVGECEVCDTQVIADSSPGGTVLVCYDCYDAPDPCDAKAL